MENLKKILGEIGLKENEITIYLSSLSIGPQPASILGKKNNISRSNTQYICTKLVQKGLLNSIETKTGNIYSSEEPEKIISMLGKEYNTLDKKMEKAHSIVTELKNIKNPHFTVPKMRYFTGVDGIIDMFEDMLTEKKTIYGALYTSSENIPLALEQYIYKSYVPKRVQLGIETRGIVNNSIEGIKYSKLDVGNKRKTMIVSQSLFPFSTDINIYGNKIAFISFSNLTGTIIEDEDIKNTFFSLFRGLWELSKTFKVNETYKDEII